MENELESELALASYFKFISVSLSDRSSQLAARELSPAVQTRHAEPAAGLQPSQPNLMGKLLEA